MLLSTLASRTPPKPPELSRTRDPIFENDPWAPSSAVAPPSKFRGGCNSEVIAVDKESAYTPTSSAAPRRLLCSSSSSSSSSRSAVVTINSFGAIAKHDLKNSKKVEKNKKDEKAEQESIAPPKGKVTMVDAEVKTLLQPSCTQSTRTVTSRPRRHSRATLCESADVSGSDGSIDVTLCMHDVGLDA
mmetsp:Transcript_65126/g.212220  ORF Transcript_65126/g.212220 Transcript_65126/m.212220 type:complete len:187 (+) Transcript_65126:369-929(+)